MEPKRTMPECLNTGSLLTIIVCVILTIALILIFVRARAHAGSAAGCETKKVSLDKKYIDAEETFNKVCGKCHTAPGPAEPTCISGLKQAELLAIRGYLDTMSEGPMPGLDCLEPEGKPIFEKTCEKCHALPDPTKPSCISEMTEEDLSLAHTFMESVRAGRELYKSRCSSCHELINPSSHTTEYWSKHLCSREGNLDENSQQTILLYLKSHSKK